MKQHTSAKDTTTKKTKIRHRVKISKFGNTTPFSKELARKQAINVLYFIVEGCRPLYRTDSKFPCKISNSTVLLFPLNRDNFMRAHYRDVIVDKKYFFIVALGLRTMNKNCVISPAGLIIHAKRCCVAFVHIVYFKIGLHVFVVHIFPI